MRTISQRELRNNSGAVMREVRSGASFRVTSNGEQIAVLSPAEHDLLAEMTVRRAVAAPPQFPPRVRVAERTEDVLAELRGRR